MGEGASSFFKCRVPNTFTNRDNRKIAKIHEPILKFYGPHVIFYVNLLSVTGRRKVKKKRRMSCLSIIEMIYLTLFKNKFLFRST